MADDDELNLDDGGSSAVSSKKGGLGNFFPTILKWIIICIAAIIVMVVVCIVCIKIFSNNKSGDYDPTLYSEEYTAVGEYYDWYKNIEPIQAFTNDDPPATVRVTVYLGYKKDDKATSAEITLMSVDIKDFLRNYFRSKSASELKVAANEERFKIEIKNAINDKYLRTSSKIKAISFDQLDVVEQN